VPIEYRVSPQLVLRLNNISRKLQAGLTSDEARNPCRNTQADLPLHRQIRDGVLLHDRQQHNDRDNQNVEINRLRIRLTEPPADPTHDGRIAQWTRRLPLREEDGARDGVAHAIDKI
jgi:hypothetical protein